MTTIAQYFTRKLNKLQGNKRLTKMEEAWIVKLNNHRMIQVQQKQTIINEYFTSPVLTLIILKREWPGTEFETNSPTKTWERWVISYISFSLCSKYSSSTFNNTKHTILSSVKVLTGKEVQVPHTNSVCHIS